MTEWLETDGLGGFAMGTHDWIRTRRYHALLLAGGRALACDVAARALTAENVTRL